ncbi:unnamed protein product [Heterobilharzia americana]|nr:unnamed protein product [Heterobilharzia americana]
MVTKSANCLSEYGKAFAYLDSARNEYYDRLKFRIQRRNSEYAHQPFLWGDLDDLHHRDSEVLQLDHGKSSNEELKNNNDISLDVSPHNSSTGSVADEELVSCLGDVQQAVSGTLNHSKKDVGTQTQRTGLQKTIEQSKAFVPYAFGGSPAPISGIKRTFNVKSDRDVYPSAMRAEVRRKEKLLGCKQMSTLNTKRSGLFGPNSHVFKVQAHEPCKAVKRSSPVSRKSTVGVIGALQPSGLVASYANLNNHTDRETENAWTSEYIQKYPSYPSSVLIDFYFPERCVDLNNDYQEALIHIPLPFQVIWVLYPRRKDRSRSNERYTSHSLLRERNRQRSRSKNLDYSPRRSVSPPEQQSRFSRLRKPEIQSSVNPITDFQTEGVRSTIRGSHSSISLTERFTRLTNSGTAVYNKRRYGRFGDNHRLPHLILTNNTKLPLATLMRQAKEISIVIERTFPLDVDLSPLEKSRTFDFRSSQLTIPRRTNEGHKPIFDRPGMKFYNTVAEEANIYKRLADTISSSNSRKSQKLESKRESEYHDISHFTGPGRFYGSRVDERFLDSKRTYPLDPSEIPKGQSYYLHDDRADDGYGPRRRRNNTQPDRLYSSSYRRDRRPQRPSRSPSRSRSSRLDVTTKKWLHDKFEEIEGDSSSQKPVPMPVPAPKPILWSTIGKEIVNGKKTTLSEDQNYSPNSAANQSPLTDSDNPAKVQSVVNSTRRTVITRVLPKRSSIIMKSFI